MTEAADRNWTLDRNDVHEVHVRPAGDLIEHAMTAECECGPTSELIRDEQRCVEGWMVTHHSLDGREQREAS